MLRLIDCVEAVAFDLDGTLVDTAPDMAAAVNMMLVMLGGRTLPEDRIPALIGDGVDEFVAKALQESSGRTAIDPAMRAAAATLFRHLYGQRLFERGGVYPGAHEVLETLSRAAIPACCITNKESVLAVRLIEAAGLHGRFAMTLCADRTDLRKPSPALLLGACAQLRIEPANLLYVGDSASDICAARAAGCRIVAVSYGYGDPVQLAAAQPDAVVGNLMDIITAGMRPSTRAPRLRAVS